MKFADFPFLRYLPFLICGVLLSQKGVQVSVAFLAGLLGFMWILYGFFVLTKKNLSGLIPAFLAYGLLFFLGLLLSEIQKTSVVGVLDENLTSSDFYLARVKKHDVEKPNSFENQLEVIAIRDSLGWEKSSQKVLIYHKSKEPLQPGQVTWVEKSPEKIPPAIFPNEFDYSEFLARKGIHFRQFIGERFKIIDSSEVGSSKYWLTNLRRDLLGIIESKVPDTESQQIAAALLLGQKDNLDKEIKNAYSETGTMHILAVSGLHVGIIYAILLYPLKGIKLTKRSRKVYLVLVILLIWLYAVLTGFSPSVVRAATMFSLFTAGQMRDRKPSSFNVLAFSAIIMIVMDPGVIFEVGFQLSYLAVGGIVLVQPLILRWWLPPNRILEYIWQLTAVSLAAQLATFPLSVFYFHSFPSYFLIANLVIVPLAFVVMAVGIAFLALSWMPVVGDWLGGLVSYLIEFQNWITFFIQQLPVGNLERLTITLAAMVFVWGLMIAWANWELGDRKKLVYFSLCLFLVWSGDRLVREIRRPASGLYIFSGEKGMLMDFQLGEKSWAWNENFPPEQLSFSIDPNRIALQRPLIPEVAEGISGDSIRWFPIWDFYFEPGEKKFHWGKQKPTRIEQLFREGSKELHLSDSLIANNGAFRIVF